MKESHASNQKVIKALIDVRKGMSINEVAEKHDVKRLTLIVWCKTAGVNWRINSRKRDWDLIMKAVDSKS